jgi:sec-independent protein translocase protein TatC
MIKALLGLGVGFIVSLLFGQELISILARPALLALQSSGMEPQIYVVSLPESFMTYLKVSMFAGIFVASPWIFRQLWGFIAAGLYPNERRYVQVFVPFATILFILGGVFLIWLVAPITCRFFVEFNKKFPMPDITSSFILPPEMQEQIPASTEPNSLAPPSAAEKGKESQKEIESTRSLLKPMFRLKEYISLILLLALAFGLAFQMPLAVLLLGQLGIVRIETFKKIRKYAVFGIVILAAVMTPPDVISQVALAVPMYLLYEFGIILLRYWPKRKKSNN